MVRDWKGVLKKDPTDWLLEPENPSVRYFTLRDIIAYPPDDPEVLKAKEAIRNSRKVSRIFSRQRPGGFWESPGEPYKPKYRSTYWQIMILGMLGLDRGDERVRRAVDYIFQFQHDEGGFTGFKEEGARREYEHVRERAMRRGKNLPPFEQWAEERIRESELSCLTGNVVLALIRLGYAGDGRVRRALNWLVEVQNADGGWLCPYWKAHVRDRHGCFMGTIAPLDAFSELPAEYRTSKMRVAIERGVEFLLMHRLFKADHHGFRVIDESWLKLGFPQFFYDILRGLSVVTKLGYAEDERVDDALEILLQKQSDDGRWTLESTPTGRMQTNLEQKGKPSRWITLNALRVIKEVSQKRDSTRESFTCISPQEHAHR